jgi:DNA-binding CsgD family transcriptional regulator
MAALCLEDIIASIKRLPVSAAATDLNTYEIVAVNDKIGSLVGTRYGELVGTDVRAHLWPDELDSVRLAYAAMAAGAVDGYEAKGALITRQGDRVPVIVWGRRVECSDKVYGLWFLESRQELSATFPLPRKTSGLVLAMTDHDWQIEYMNADASLLGVQGSDLRGFPLLGLLHPSAVVDFLTAAGQAASRDIGVSVWTRVRVGSESWADRYCFLVRMCSHEPPRLGIVVSDGPGSGDGDGGDPFEAEARHCAMQARALKTLGALPSLTGLPHGGELSARQTEIVSRLIAGERVPQISRSMFLSQSTVRNHLTATYKKFGVHSQAALLAALLRASTSHAA